MKIVYLINGTRFCKWVQYWYKRVQKNSNQNGRFKAKKIDIRTIDKIFTELSIKTCKSSLPKIHCEKGVMKKLFCNEFCEFFWQKRSIDYL